MNTAVINIKTDKIVKKQAQDVAAQLGLNLSSVINAYLRQFVRTRKVELNLDEKPSKYLIRQLKQAEKDIKVGNVSPVFKTGEEAVAWLEKQGI